MSALQVGRCPVKECDAAVTLADLQAVDAGEPIWRCADGHDGPGAAGANRH